MDGVGSLKGLLACVEVQKGEKVCIHTPNNMGPMILDFPSIHSLLIVLQLLNLISPTVGRSSVAQPSVSHTLQFTKISLYLYCTLDGSETQKVPSWTHVAMSIPCLYSELHHMYYTFAILKNVIWKLLKSYTPTSYIYIYIHI